MTLDNWLMSAFGGFIEQLTAQGGEDGQSIFLGITKKLYL